jgi:hypothetical protein
MLADDAPIPAQPKPVRRLRGWIGCLVVLAIAAGVCAGGWLVVRYLAAGADNANVRDCLADDRGENPPYRRVSCEDGEARYRVLAIAERPSTGANPCVDVPGASRLFETTRDNQTVCIGDKDADPARSANIAREGDCLRVVRDADAERLDCADPRANFEVLRRLTNVFVSDLRAPPGVPTDGPCSDVPATTTRYSFQWRSEDVAPRGPKLPGRHFDLMFCLGRVHEPPPAVPNAPVSCRFVTADGVLAAVNAVDGKRDNREEFTLDGMKAAWRVGSLGVGYLSVARPGGNFEVILVFESGYPFLREAAVEIYRAAGPHLP